MHHGLLAERPDRSEQPGMTVVNARVARQRVARMQVERHVEPLDHGPERPVLRQVVIGHGVGAIELRKSVDQRAAEAEFLDAALELARGEVRVLHCQRREALKSLRALDHLLGEIIVGASRDLVGARLVGDALHRRRVERQQHHLDAVLVHKLKPPAVNVGVALGHLVADRFGEIAHRIGRRFGDRKVFFECDLALHTSVLPVCFAATPWLALILTRALRHASCAAVPRLSPLAWFWRRRAQASGVVSFRGSAGTRGETNFRRTNMNTLPSYTLASRPEMSRLLRTWAALSRGTFAVTFFLLDIALIVAVSCATGVAYTLFAYGDPGDITVFVQVGVLAASIFAVSNAFRGEYRLPNYFSVKPHARG